MVKVNDAPGAIKKENVDGVSHSEGVYRFFASQKEAFAGLQRRMSKQAFHPGPGTGRDHTSFDEDDIPGRIDGTHVASQDPSSS